MKEYPDRVALENQLAEKSVTRSRKLLVVLILSFGLTLALLAGLQIVQATPTAANFFVKPDGDGSACTQSNPCALQTALDQAIKDDSVLYIASGTYTGTGAAVITLTRSILLYGGWDGSLFGPIRRDPAVYKSILNGEQKRRVVHISGDITPTLDGFTIANGNATGLNLADCQPKADGCGGSIFVLNAHPLIADNIITNNIAAVTTSGFSTRTNGYGGGLYLANAAQAVISGNLIISNAASTAYFGEGGGVYLIGNASGIQVQFNRVFSNSATTTDTFGMGGGLWIEVENALIQGNVIARNRTNRSGIGDGAGLYEFAGSNDYLGNLAQENEGTSAVKLQNSRSRFEGNRVVDNATAQGIQIEGPGGSPTLANNVVAHSGDKTIVATGASYTGTSLSANLLHNTLIGSGSGTGVYVESGYVTLFLINTIVTSHTWGITNTVPASSTVLADHMLFWDNAHDGVRGTNPVDGDPTFLPDGYHLGLGSAAIDAGVPTIVTNDVDGERRPDCVLWDIGADELQGLPCQRSYLPIVLRN